MFLIAAEPDVYSIAAVYKHALLMTARHAPSVDYYPTNGEKTSSVFFPSRSELQSPHAAAGTVDHAPHNQICSISLSLRGRDGSG